MDLNQRKKIGCETIKGEDKRICSWCTYENLKERCDYFTGELGRVIIYERQI